MANTFPGKATLTGNVVWSDSTPFDGYLLLGIVLPQNADGQWPTAVIEGIFPPVRLPIWTMIPISSGVFDTNSYVWYSTSISPGNTQYVAYWYDLNKRRLFPATGVNPAPFAVATTPYAINLPTLTVPGTSSNYPAPADSTTGGV